ncbi:hypothetical protein ABW21_db0201036 [Orbilia brochopaga]|nr:hypothetical protein ABW21_db0201036 [Drechslerella brochopaga]
MAYKFDSQAAHIQALTETIAVPPYIPVTSPSAKRKRDLLLYISPVSADSSFNSASSTVTDSASTSFGSDVVCGSCEGSRNGTAVHQGASSDSAIVGGIEGAAATAGAGCSCEEMKNGGDKAGADKAGEEPQEAPSPRTRVANKLEALSLGVGAAGGKDSEPLSSSAKVVKSWRKAGGVGKFKGFEDVTTTDGATAADIDIPLEHEEDDSELNRTPRKKRATKPPSSRDVRSKDVDVTPKKRKGKAKVILQEPSEVEMTTVDDVPADTETQLPGNDSESPVASSSSNEPFAFVGSSSKQSRPSRGRLRSPPPSIPEEDIQQPAAEEDTDSDPDQTGIGYRPTAQQRELRNQKRMQQIKEYKARESREARAKRTAERRRRNVAERVASATSSTSSLIITANPEDGDEMDDVQKSLPAKKVHFAL